MAISSGWIDTVRGLRPRNWSLRLKLAVLMVIGAAAPLLVSTYIEAVQIRTQSMADIQQLLEARTEQIGHEIDRIHSGYLTAASRMAQFADIRNFCASPQSAVRAAAARTLLRTFPSSDAAVAGAGIIGREGRVALATDLALESIPTQRQSAVARAFSGERAIAGVDTPVALAEQSGLVSYLVPIHTDQGPARCVAVLWVRTDPFWAGLKAAAGQAGAGSYAVLYDALGVRIGHTFDDANLYHPGAELDRQTIETLVQEGRFGTRTRALLEEAKPFAEQFRRARDVSPDRAVFRGISPVNSEWTMGVARRLATVPWTAFVMVPEAVIENGIARKVREKVLLAVAIVSIAALAGAFFATGLLWPIRVMQEATTRLTTDPATRVPLRGEDELGQLATSFNVMAARLQQQELALREANDRLERTVQERTAALSDQQQLLAAIIDNTAAPIYVKDLEGRFVLVNRHFLQIFNVTREQVIGQTDHILMDAAAADAVRATDMKVMRDNAPVTLEETVPQADDVHTYLSVKSPYRDKDGRVIGLFGVSADITERQRAQARQRAQLDRLNLLDQMTTAIARGQQLSGLYDELATSLEARMPVDFACVMGWDEQDPGTLVVRSVGARGQAQAAALGLPGGGQVPIGQNGLSRCVGGVLVHEPDTALIPHPFAQKFASLGLRSLVLVPLSSDGKTFGLLLAARANAGAFDSGDCEFLRQLGDHTSLAAHQVRLYEKLQDAYADLQASQQRVLQHERLRALGEMASGIAHDINNALSPVSMYAEALLASEHSLAPRSRHYLEVIARGIDDVAATVARMREFYRQEPDDAVRESLDLNEAARHAAELTEARWRDQALREGRSIEMALRLDSAAVKVLAVSAEIREALVNLIFNAVDALPGGGTITLATGVETGADGRSHPWIEVRDNGTGMDEETLRRCLEPFFTTKGRRGTGLGLAMVYGIAQRHGAQLSVESVPRHGTTVRMAFGAQPGNESLPVSIDADEARALAAPLRILVIDDDSQILQSLRLLLESDGHAVVICEGGAAGIAAFEERSLSRQPFDLVITDLGMPGVGGAEVAAAVKRSAPTVPVLLLTGWGQRLLDDGELPPHVDAVLEKPPKLRVLRAALRSATATGRPSTAAPPTP